MTNVFSLCSGTSNPLSQLNSEVASWTTKRKDNHSCTSILMKILVNTDFPFSQHMISISIILMILIPLPQIVELLQDSLSLTDDGLKDTWTTLSRESMNCRCNYLPIKPLYLSIKMGKPSILILLKFFQQMLLYLSTMLKVMNGLS